MSKVINVIDRNIWQEGTVGGWSDGQLEIWARNTGCRLQLIEDGGKGARVQGGFFHGLPRPNGRGYGELKGLILVFP